MDDAARRPPASRLAGMSAPMVFALTFEHWLFQAMALVAVGVEIWAFVDVLRRGPAEFLRAGQRDRSFWLLLTGIALAVGAMGLLMGAGLGMFSIAAVCVAAVYLAGPRGELRLYSR